MKQIDAISASMFTRLLLCPLQVSLDRLGTQLEASNRQISPNAALGLLVHRAFELSFRNRTSFELAWVEARTEARFAQINFDVLKSYRRTYLRAEKRHADIQSLIAEHDGDAPEPEMDFQAHSGRIIGQIDLFVGGETPFVLDYKTGMIMDEAGNLQEKIVRQLHVYAGAISEQRGIHVRTGYIVPMSQPPIKIDIDPDLASKLLIEMLAAMDEYNDRGQGNQPAMPNEENCHWCRHSHQCASLKAAICNGAMSRPGGFDFVWGEVMSDPQISRSGLCAIQIKPHAGTIEGQFTIFDIPDYVLTNVNKSSLITISGIPRSGEARNWKQGTTRISLQ
jgi:CRISPR/Cas system-associated exonuclease Cas4 (RecB family)